MKKKSSLDKPIITLRNTLREYYEAIILEKFEYAYDQDLEVQLWKNCFYKVIEDFRKRIRKSSGKTGSDEVVKICELFYSFLCMASKFYEELNSKLQNKYSLLLDGTVDISFIDLDQSSVQFKAYVSCHRSLIYMGDLYRYHRDLYGHPNQKDWILASIYYSKALYLYSDNGNPHNQMAVLATYAEEDIKALYRYYRSLLVLIPFPTAQDNLSVLFDKNKSKLDNLNTNILNKNRFSLLFIRCTGMYFKGDVDLEELKLIECDLLNLISNLMENKDLEEEILLYLLIICIYNVELYIPDVDSPYLPECIDFLLSYAEKLLYFTIHRIEDPIYLNVLSIFLDYLSAKESIRLFLDNRPSFWTLFVNLLNTFQIKNQEPVIEDSVYNNITLQEEREVYGFLPLRNLYKLTNNLSNNSLSSCNAKRILKLILFAIKAKNTNYIYHSGEYWSISITDSKTTLNNSNNNNNSISMVDSSMDKEEEEEEEEEVAMEDKKNVTTDISSEEEMEEEVILFKPSTPTSTSTNFTSNVLWNSNSNQYKNSVVYNQNTNKGPLPWLPKGTDSNVTCINPSVLFNVPNASQRLKTQTKNPFVSM